MRFFRKLGLSAFALWLAFLTMFCPAFYSQNEVKASFTMTPYYMNDFTLNGVIVSAALAKEMIYTIFYQRGGSIISSGDYNGDYLLKFSLSNYTDSDTGLPYYQIYANILTVSAPWGIYDNYKNIAWYTFPGNRTCSYSSTYDSRKAKVEFVYNWSSYCSSNNSFSVNADTERLSDGTWVYTGSFGLTGSVYHDRDPEKTGDYSWSFNTSNVQNRTLSRAQLKKWAYEEDLITDEKQYCSYKISPSVLTDSDKQILQSYDSDIGSTIYNQVTALLSITNNSIYNLINGLNKIQKSITGTSAYSDSALAVLNKLMGASNASGEGYYKDDNGVIHSYGGGVTRGGGAGRDGGTETVGNHQVQRCYDVDTGTYQPTGDIKINNTTSKPYEFTIENIYYITENYYINNNYEIIEGFTPDEDKPPATGTDTDIPPIVNPGDDWPEDTPGWIEFLGNLISGLLQGLGDAIGGLGSAIGGIANALGNIISSLITALTDLFKTLFVPSSEFLSNSFTGIKDNFESKFPFLDQADEAENSIIGTIQDADSSAPSYDMELPEILGGGSVQVFDFSFYDQYRDLVNGGILFFAWSTFIMRLPRKLSKAIGGVN